MVVWGALCKRRNNEVTVIAEATPNIRLMLLPVGTSLIEYHWIIGGSCIFLIPRSKLRDWRPSCYIVLPFPILKNKISCLHVWNLQLLYIYIYTCRLKQASYANEMKMIREKIATKMLGSWIITCVWWAMVTSNRIGDGGEHITILNNLCYGNQRLP